MSINFIFTFLDIIINNQENTVVQNIIYEKERKKKKNENEIYIIISVVVLAKLSEITHP